MATNCRFAFGIHVMSVLALHREVPCSSEMLAQTVNTNAVVIRRLLLDLKEAGLIETRRGPGGGAKLARAAGEITLAQVFEATSGRFQAFGEHPNPPAQCCRVGRGIEEVLDTIARKAAQCIAAQYAAISLQNVVDSLGDI